MERSWGPYDEARERRFATGPVGVVGQASWHWARLVRLELPEVLVAGALVANLFVVFGVTHFPYQDAPNYLARYVLIERILSGESVPWVKFRWIPSSYLGLDLLGVTGVWLFGAAATGKIFAALAATLPTLGMYLLLRATAPMRRGWAVLGALTTLSWFFLAGLLNFVIGFGLALCYIALWWPRRGSPSWVFSLGMAALIAPLFLVHLSAPLIVLGVMGVNFGVLLLTGRGRAAFSYIYEPLPRLLALCTLVLACVWWWTAASGEAGFDLSTPTVFRSAASKIAALGAPFYSFSLTQAAIMAASYLVMLLIFILLYGKTIWKDPFFLASLMFFFLFLVFPNIVGGATATDIRWLVPAYILPFCCAGEPRSHLLHSPFLLVFAFCLCIVNAAVIFSWTVKIERELDDFDAALSELPAGSRVLPLIFTKETYPRVTPYEQYALWHVIRGRGAVPGLWSFIASRDGQKLPHMQHFVTSRRYDPEVPGELDWRRISGEYDFIIVAATVEQTRREIGALAPQIARFGRISIHQAPKLQPPPRPG